MRHTFEISALNSTYNGYVLCLGGCIWVWVGEGGLTSLGLSHFPRSSMIIDTPNTQSICVKTITSRIAKRFQDKQVFFSTDISEEDPRFWQEVFSSLQPELDKISLPQNMEALDIAQKA